jgi:hypothetical protein
MQYCYDVEVYPNFFCAYFGNGSETHYFEISPWRNDGVALLEFCKGKTLLGYNNHEYDDYMLNLLYFIGSKIRLTSIVNTALYQLSLKIINQQIDYRYKWSKEGKTEHYNSIDLMKLHAFHKVGVGLKQVGINLLHNKIQDLPLPYNKQVTQAEGELLKQYNLNDLAITIKLWEYSKKDLTLREEISKSYAVNVMSADRSKIANVILEQYYAKYTGQQKADFKDQRTFVSTVALDSIVSKKIRFETPQMKSFHSELVSEVLTADENEKFSFKRELSYGSKTYDIGVGGLHSRDHACVLESDEEYLLIDADVGSFYPMIMILEQVKPDHLHEKFLEIVRDITYERLDAKDSGEELKAEVLKITINSIFGKLGSAFHYLLDKSAMFKVTVNGQLFLLMLIEALETTGFEVVSANTDGVTARVKRSRMAEYNAVCDKWKANTGFKLEYTKYSKIIRRDVNNYLAILEGCSSGDILKEIKAKKIKTKGVFEQTISLTKGYKHPIVSRAIAEYFVNGTPAHETIGNCTDIYQFLLSQKTGKEFITRRYSIAGEILEDLQKNNRYFVSLKGDIIQKSKRDGSRKTSLVAGEFLTLMNDVPENFSTENVKVEWYEAEAQKVIDVIEGREPAKKGKRKNKIQADQLVLF